MCVVYAVWRATASAAYRRSRRGGDAALQGVRADPTRRPAPPNGRLFVIVTHASPKSNRARRYGVP